MDHDQCVFKCTPFADKPPIYLGMYVDGFVYFSNSDQVKEWFEQHLGAKLKADFIGAVSWFLGRHYDWHRLDDGRLTCHISQQAFVEGLLEIFGGMEDCIPSNRIYKQELSIDRVNRDNVPLHNEKEFLQSYQSLLGGLTWLMINTRLDLGVIVKILSQFNCKPSLGHMDSAKYVLWYLKQTPSHGIWYTQNEERLHGSIAFPEQVYPDELTVFTNSCWGAQDASKP